MVEEMSRRVGKLNTQPHGMHIFDSYLCFLCSRFQESVLQDVSDSSFTEPRDWV